MRNIVFALVITLTLSFSATFDEAEIEYQKGNFDKAFSLLKNCQFKEIQWHSKDLEQCIIWDKG